MSDDAKYIDALLANGRLREERDRLRTTLDHIAAGDFAELATELEQHKQIATDLRSENNRLREALEKIDSLPDYAPVQSAQDIARAALAKEDNT